MKSKRLLVRIVLAFVFLAGAYYFLVVDSSSIIAQKTQLLFSDRLLVEVPSRIIPNGGPSTANRIFKIDKALISAQVMPWHSDSPNRTQGLPRAFQRSCFTYSEGIRTEQLNLPFATQEAGCINFTDSTFDHYTIPLTKLMAPGEAALPIGTSTIMDKVDTGFADARKPAEVAVVVLNTWYCGDTIPRLHAYRMGMIGEMKLPVMPEGLNPSAARLSSDGYTLNVLSYPTRQDFINGENGSVWAIDLYPPIGKWQHVKSDVTQDALDLCSRESIIKRVEDDSYVVELE